MSAVRWLALSALTLALLVGGVWAQDFPGMPVPESSFFKSSFPGSVSVFEPRVAGNPLISPGASGNIIGIGRVSFTETNLHILGSTTGRIFFGGPSLGSGGAMATFVANGDEFRLAPGATAGNTAIVTLQDSAMIDHATTQGDDPSFYVYGRTPPTTDADRWVRIRYEDDAAQQRGTIVTGEGPLWINPAAAGMRIPRVIDAAPAPPVTCAADHAGTIVYVDDSNDGAAAQLCLCAEDTNDATYDWIRLEGLVGGDCTLGTF